MDDFTKAYDNGYYMALVDVEKRINAVLQGQEVTTASKDFLATAFTLFKGMLTLRLQALSLSMDLRQKKESSS